MARMKFLCDSDRCIECNACVTACKNEHEVPWGMNRRRVVTIQDGGFVWVLGPENGARARVKALVTDRVARGVAFMPFHFSGWYQGVDQRAKYPKGTDPIVLGESVNTVTTYGFDPVTGMQETKATLCQIRAA